MSTPAEPHGLIRSKLDKSGLPGHELARRLLAFADKPKKRVGPKASPNDQPADSVSDVKQAIATLDLWHIFEQNRCVKAISKHGPTPPRSNTTERVRIGPQFSLPRNELTGVIDERIAAARPTAELFRAITFATFTKSAELLTPVNDNAGWNPLDAA